MGDAEKKSQFVLHWSSCATY